MNFPNPLIVLAGVLLLSQNTALAATAEDEAAERHARLAAETRQALEKVEIDQLAAESALESAHQQLQEFSQQKEMAAKLNTAERAARDAEMAKMNEELNHARRQLNETSREISRVNREVARARSRSGTSNYVFQIDDRPVIGVILGDADDVGIKVLGVSPDGPSERAGIKQGDVIIAIGGRVLAAVDETGDVRHGLSVALEDIKATEPVIVSVERGDQTLDLTVIPELREPLVWSSVIRFPTAPVSPINPHTASKPTKVIRIERIVVPEIDTEALTEHIERMRIDIDARRLMMEASRGISSGHDFEFEFHELSEMGDFALHDANLWFGLPMARGLKLAEVNAGLGEYFKTDRGVLVLNARDDNDLQLESGDVILQVGETEVNSPAEFMRALRDFEAGQEFDIDIKRNRKNRTLQTTMPERRTSFFVPHVNRSHRVTVSSQD